MILKVLRLHEKNDNRDWLNKMSAKSLCILHIDFSVLIFPNSTRTLLISLFLMEQVGYGMQTMIPSSSMSAENIAGCWSQPLNKLKPSRTQGCRHVLQLYLPQHQHVLTASQTCTFLFGFVWSSNRSRVLDQALLRWASTLLKLPQ